MVQGDRSASLWHSHLCLPQLLPPGQVWPVAKKAVKRDFKDRGDRWESDFIWNTNWKEQVCAYHHIKKLAPSVPACTSSLTVDAHGLVSGAPWHGSDSWQPRPCARCIKMASWLTIMPEQLGGQPLQHKQSWIGWLRLLAWILGGSSTEPGHPSFP